MADCKACGAWFSSTAPSELCPTCERALKRLNGFAVPVVRCKACEQHIETKSENVVYCKKYNRFMKVDDFCSYGERRSNGT